MILGAGMEASSKNQLKERLFMIKNGKRPKKLITLLALTIALALTITTGFATNALAETKENKNNNDFAVMVKDDGLWTVNLSKSGNEIIIDKGGVFKNPSISPDGQNVAYTKDEVLYISPIGLNQGNKESIKVSEKVVSYAWANSNNLSYSTEKGGLNGFNLKSKNSSNYIESEERYESIVGDGKGTIYGEVYRYYIKDNHQYAEAKGLISYKVALGKSKVIVPSQPISEDGKNKGLMPAVAGISKDGDYVYIWCKVHSGSTNSDGVPFGVYEVKNNKFTPFNEEQIFALAYRDNLAINPVDGRLSVLNNGGVRNMNINKTLGEVDGISGTFTPILPQNMIASDEPYGITAKGMVTMTPAFSPDGKKIIFSTSNANENMQQWDKDPHNIYTVDLGTKKVEKITKDNTFDFDPTYISNGAGIVFARRTDENDISLWRLQDNKEECISKDIKLDKNSWYYGHYKLENILDIYISEK
jgi:hypothetical protein